MNNNHFEESDEQDPKIYENDEAYMFDGDGDVDGDVEGECSNNNSIDQINKQNVELLNNNDDVNDDEVEGAVNETDLQANFNHTDITNLSNNNPNNIYHPPHQPDQDEEDETVRNKDDEDNENENEEENEIEGEEDTNPLITLNYISICQCCKSPFDSVVHVPYLFRCGHFFCKQCIEENFTDDEGIKCPNDGLVAYSLSNLKLLNNLITDKDIDVQSQRGIFCEIHKGQKLTHYIEDTKELICVYCAFAKFKKNPKTEIKEIKDKNTEMITELNSIIEDNQHNVEMIQSALKDIKKNKETEEKRVNMFFEQIMSFYKNKKNEILNQINSLFTENAKKLSQKLELFSSKIEQSENLKKLINNEDSMISQANSFSFLEMLERFNKLTKSNNDKMKLNVQLSEYRFMHEEESKLLKYINNIGDLQIGPKNFVFNGGKDDMSGVDFNFKTMKMNTSYNVAQSANEMLLNNSDLQMHQQSSGNNTNNYEYRQHGNQVGNVIGTQNGRGERKAYLGSTATTIGGSNVNKNSSSKYSYNKPMTPGEYRTEYRSEHMNRYQRNFK
jgi:hypothetical protein